MQIKKRKSINHNSKYAEREKIKRKDSSSSSSEEESTNFLYCTEKHIISARGEVWIRYGHCLKWGDHQCDRVDDNEDVFICDICSDIPSAKLECLLNLFGIAEILNICEDSDDAMEDDDNSIADPDYQAENEMGQEQFSNDETEDDEVNIDEIIRSSGDSGPDPSTSTSALLTGSQPTQSEGRPREPQKLNLRWKKQNLFLNEQQLRFTGKRNLTKRYFRS
ncbi:hypothetical protein HHI36_013492 [Cryptolaemus montrouzieri]|uniref:Uncharacterized protein n=1 Tax=Cryptolaemus montrouzieri TaxID=559131 RepID=A0ABD2NHX6_9CUCU